MADAAQEVIFEVKEENLETGARGIPLGYCTTSSVDPQEGLFYMERPVSELASRDPEAVIYLLYNKQEGSDQEVKDFARELARRSVLRDETVQAIRSLPREMHPMDMMVAALAILGGLEGTGDYHEDCLNLIAKIPELCAILINHHAGWEPCRPSNPDVGYMENFTQMLNVPNADEKELAEVFRLFNVLHYDHGGGNLSAFTGKAVASGMQHLYGSLAAAMSALAGPRHGKANQDCLEFVKEVAEALGEDATPEKVEQFVRDRLARKELVYGFGHAVLRVEDPRATVQYQVAQERYADHPLVKIALMLRSEGTKVLKENEKISNPYPNVDAISGTLLTAAGFPYPEYYTVLFGLSRCVGIAIQIVYERCEARGGKGTPIMRPKYVFKRQVPAGV